MIDIVTKKGESYSFDPSNHRLFKNGAVVLTNEVEPIYTGNGDNSEPIFSGLYVKSTNSIITLNGNIKKVVDINQIK